jgi:hypothetical protein
MLGLCCRQIQQVRVLHFYLRSHDYCNSYVCLVAVDAVLACVQFAVEYICVSSNFVYLSSKRATNTLVLCLMYAYDWIHLSLIYLHTRMYICVYLDSIRISWIVQQEQHQVLHARIALQVNTAGTFPILILALPLLQLICWSSSCCSMVLCVCVCSSL